MKRMTVLLCLCVCLLLCGVSCSSRGGELQKRPGTVENNRVIGAEDEKEDETVQKPAPSVSTSAALTTHGAGQAPASSTPSVSLPPASQQSGSVLDEQDVGFRLRLEWTASSSEEGVTVETMLFLDCYTLTVNSVKNGFIEVNGQKRTFRTERINETVNEPHSIPICNESFTFSPDQIPPEGIGVQAQWSFGGKYGAQTIEALSLQETIIVR